MRNRLIGFALCFLALGSSAAVAQVTVHIGIPEVRIDYRVGAFPYLVRVPNYPVYYAPRLRANYFFYDGLFWVYRRGNWYASYWYDGPWAVVDPIDVPVYLLRIPVRYYRDPPPRFTAWRYDAAPRWVEVWGPTWEERRVGWDRWDRYSVPAIAPLPVYQRQYVGSRYPQLSEQTVLQSRYYRYQPRDTVARTFYQQQGVQPMAAAPATSSRQYSRQYSQYSRQYTQQYAQQPYSRQYTQQQYSQQARINAQQARINAAAAANDARMAKHVAKNEARLAKETAKSEHRMAKEAAKNEHRMAKEAAKYEKRMAKEAAKAYKAPKHQMQIAEAPQFREPKFHEPKGPKEFKEPKGGGKEHKGK
jgi:hypothetical protein